MSRLDQSVRIGAVYTRSINITRDVDALELIQAYLPTSRALQSLRQIADGFGDGAHGRALALIGPYGSGKSAFGLFTSALMAAPDGKLHQAATAVLETADPKLNARFRGAVHGQRGFLRVTVNGIPDSLVRQLMFALAESAEQAALDPALVNNILDAAEPGTPMDAVLKLVSRIQHAWSHAGGSGVLIELDELGKFLEYESFHPQHREIHLLQLLAEHAYQASAAPLHLLVMLHQAFEHYSNRLGKHLRDEWQKVQGRFEAVAFLEPAEQSLRIVAAAFERDGELPAELSAQLDHATNHLAADGALPHGLDEAKARRLFDRCYPLHPVTLLILPTLCQKVAQNERTLFSYLGSTEPFGLRERLGQLDIGDWVTPWNLYDYFILNQAGSVSDPLTYHRWVEVITALERLDGGPEDPAVRLLKTIGLLNLIGAQRGLKASHALLQVVFGDALEPLIQQLETASAIHFRNYSREYRVWQGSDFDLHGSLQQATAEQAQQPLVDILNQLSPLKPVVARRATIETGTLRCFTPSFTARDRWPPQPLADGELGLWFYLADDEDDDNLQVDSTLDSSANGKLANAPVGSVVAVCQFTERLREAVAEWMALQDLPKRHAELHHDPVAQREHRAWLNNAELETTQLIRTLLAEPEALRWFFGGRQRPVRDRRHLQQQLSRWIDYQCYPNAPRLRNELINRDRPSPSANLGRKRLLAAMLSAADQPDLGIEKTPAEKSLYLSLLKQSKLHREENGRLGFYPPLAEDDPCRLQPLWNTVTRLLGNSGESQIPLPQVYDKLRQPPLGAKLGPLPVLIVVYLLANPRDVALYQEGAFCEDLTVEQIELLCRRPELFALERFNLGGPRGDLLNRYASSIVGPVPPDATLLDFVRPLVRFVSRLPEYTLHSKSLTANAQHVRDAFQQASSPGTLLFKTLPAACESPIPPEAFSDEHSIVFEQFIQRLVGVLRELNQAYPLLLERWQQALNSALLDAPVADLHTLREALATRYHELDRYTPDRMGLGALIRRLGDTAHKSDQAWLESVATLLAKIPPSKWREETVRQAELRLRELAEQLLDLEKLRLAQPDGGGINGALLLKTVDAKRGEISHVVHVSSAQRAAATTEAGRIADSLNGRNAAEQLAIVAALLERLTNSPSPEGEARD